MPPALLPGAPEWCAQPVAAWPHLVLLYGSDDFSTREAVRGIRAAFAAQANDGSPAVIDRVADGTPLAELVHAAQTMAMFGPARRLVIGQGYFPCRSAGPTSPDESAQLRAAADTLAQLAALSPDTGVLVLREGDLLPAVAARFPATAWVKEYPLPEGASLAAWLRQRARQAGIVIEDRAVRALLDLRIADLGVLAGELDKLATYAAGRAVTADDIHRLVAAGPLGEQAFLGAIGDARPAAAIAALDRLEQQGLRADHLFGRLASTVHNLCVARALLDEAGETPPPERLEAAGLSVGQWARLASQASRLSALGLQGAHAAIVDLDRRRKSGRLQDTEALFLAVYRATTQAQA